MTIGDDGVASICMGKEHEGGPCERCGHVSSEKWIEQDAHRALLHAVELVGVRKVREWLESAELLRIALKRSTR